MALRDVRYFMRQHARQFRLRLRRNDQPGMDADIAAGHRKRVDAGIVDREKHITEARIAAGGGQSTAQLVQICLDIRVIKIGGLTPANLVHDPLADFLLDIERQIVAGRIAKLRQFVGPQRLRGQGKSQQQGE